MYTRCMQVNTSAALVREAVRKLVSAGLDPDEFLHEVSARIRRAVPHDSSAWMTLDPDTLLPSGALQYDKSPEVIRLLLRNELLDGDVQSLAELARRTSPVAALSQLDAGSAANSPRVQQILRPAGIGDELRMMLRVGGSTWGLGVICRELGSSAFDADERTFLADIAPDIAEGLRRGLSHRPDPDAAILVPGVVAFDLQGQVVSTTAEADRMTALMSGDVTSMLYAVAIAASHHDGASARVRLTDGQWLLLQGGRMYGTPIDSAQVTVALVPAPRADLTSVLLRLHRLSAREREVAELLMHGGRTDEIAARLYISNHTLRDHVKAIFTKVGARSRSELTALVSDHTSPPFAAATHH
jgi:DNA-binding CsgD family transcriptional regulator